MKINNTKRIAEKMTMMLGVHQAASTVNTVITHGIKEKLHHTFQHRGAAQ